MGLEQRVYDLERKERTRALADRRRQLQDDGYIGHVHNPESKRAIGREPCPDCGKKKLEYIGGVCEIDHPHGQVEFYRCRGCGWWSEDI